MKPIPTDLVFLAADSTEELAPLGDLRGRIRPNGGIWVVSRKGKAATLRDVETMAAARASSIRIRPYSAIAPGMWIAAE